MMTADPAKDPWRITVPAVLGLGVIVLLVGFLGAWGSLTTLSGAIVASGRLEVSSNRQVIQHPDGGVVREILVKDGDLVEAGAQLVDLDDTFVRSELAITENEIHELDARAARLVAERDGQDMIEMPASLMQVAAGSADVAALIEGQRNLFLARLETLAREQSMLTQHIDQTGNQITGTHAQITALQQQSELIAAEIADQKTLRDKGLSPESRMKALQREESRLAGELGRLRAEVARLENQITATEVERLRLEAVRREDAIAQLRDLLTRRNELAEKRLALQERLSRMQIRAPMAGEVYDSKVFAIGSVIRPADPVMYIVPQDDALIISVNVPSVHIDQVYIDQPVSLRFSAFSQRTTPVLFGTVQSVSADAFVDEVTHMSFYRIRVALDPGQVDELGGQKLVPGMPVEAFLRTDDRTPLSYLVKPFTDYFARAFRE